MGCVTLSYQEMADLMHFRCIRTPQRQVKHFEEELKFLEVDRRKIGPRQHAKNRYRLTLPLTLPQDTAQPYSIDKVGKPIHCDKRSPEVFRNPQEREKNARAHEEILQTITPEVLTRELLLLQRSLLYIGQPGWIAYDTTLEKIAYLRTMLEAFA